MGVVWHLPDAQVQVLTRPLWPHSTPNSSIAFSQSAKLCQVQNPQVPNGPRSHCVRQSRRVEQPIVHLAAAVHAAAALSSSTHDETPKFPKPWRHSALCGGQLANFDDSSGPRHSYFIAESTATTPGIFRPLRNTFDSSTSSTSSPRISEDLPEPGQASMLSSRNWLGTHFPPDQPAKKSPGTVIKNFAHQLRVANQSPPETTIRPRHWPRALLQCQERRLFYLPAGRSSASRLQTLV